MKNLGGYQIVRPQKAQNNGAIKAESFHLRLKSLNLETTEALTRLSYEDTPRFLVDIAWEAHVQRSEVVGAYISYVISVYDAGISAHKFTTLVPNLVWVPGFSLGTTLVA